ncbi:uncharacterized protein LOC128861205 [Anastrepha ludens]|uniref:uncharacterized protein LOC128861205 n=1 Tax=Anastrepha ludens TaxID=28586 RepID=UPI0023B0E039|nr:uncharacterized protein LOC128861205 [Anastrepha ludens]
MILCTDNLYFLCFNITATNTLSNNKCQFAQGELISSSNDTTLYRYALPKIVTKNFRSIREEEESDKSHRLLPECSRSTHKTVNFSKPRQLVYNYDIICITETWLQPAIHDGEVLDPTYNIYRRDRNQATSGCQRGGGVLIATKRHIQVESIQIKENNIEELFIKIKINNDNLILGCVYIPPHTTYEAYHTHLSAISFLSDSFQNASLLVLGDFNMASSSPRNECTRLLYDSYSTSGCKQCNRVFNEQGNLLDLCFSNTGTIPYGTVALVPEDKYHPALAFQLNFQPSLTPVGIPNYAFKKADYASLNVFFMRTNWTDLYQQKSVDEKLRWLYNIIQEGVTQFVPVYFSKPSRFPPWFSRELTEKIILKKAAHTQVEGSLKDDTKAFWNYIKDKKRGNSDIPASMVWDNQSASSGVEISNLFAQFFKSIYAPVSDDSVTLAHSHPYTQSVNLNDFEVTFDNVFKQLNSVDPSKGAGLDGLPNAFLKNCANGLCETLTHIFQSSLQCGVFPTDWKLSYISPIHKEGPKKTVTNYRPICIQSALAKLFEKLILPKLSAAFDPIITTRQHSFISSVQRQLTFSPTPTIY